jgi:hypothetical protein
MPPRKWDDATKATALELYASEGGKVASERTGVPEGTIRNWAKRTTDAIERAAGVEIVTSPVTPMAWPERRELVVKELGGLVQLALERTRHAFERGKMRDARDGAVALAILCDKAQLLSGGTTSRSEAFSVNMSPDDVKARIAALEAELGAPEIEQ